MSRIGFRLDHLALWICIVILAVGLMFSGGETLVDSRLESARSRIREALASMPNAIGTGGEWIMVRDDVVPPTQADILGLNAHTSRTYQRLGDTPVRRARLFIANSADARSMTGHHPPNCYPKSGYEMDSAMERGLEVDTSIETRIPVRIYRFLGGTDQNISLTVVSGFLMPDGRAAATLAETMELASRAATSRLGLTQFQIVFEGNLPESDVDRYAGEILAGLPAEVYLAVGGVVDAQEGGGT